MVHARRAALGKGLLATFALFALVLAGLSPASGAPPATHLGPVESARDAAAVYIVQMAEDPVVAYDGGEAGYAPTKPGRGQHVNPNSAHVRRYSQLLDRRHAEALAAAGAPAEAKFYDYRFSYNGFAATLTPAQVARLEQQPNVVAVSLDETRQPTTDNTTVEMGISTPGGFWQTAGKGEDVIIGVIDTGIWPEHPSFSDQTDLADRPGRSGKRTIAPWYQTIPSDWHGTCQSGEQWSQDDCNNKLIGTRYFIEGLTRRGVDPADYASARDRDGHGTHTASTAGGNEGVDPSIFGRDLGVGTISGMAPRARIAAYKGCFGEAGCVTSDLVMAIDTAVADGVDVINYSIGSNTPAMLSPDAVAFLFARQANVFVATSAGNAGPGEFTVGSPAASPWLTAVGASTHSRIFTNTVTLGDGTPVEGGSVTLGAGPAPLVDGGEGCGEGTLDPAEVSGAIVFCLRVTGIPRITHGANVAAAGGVGMILFDPPQVNVTPTDNHLIPTSTVLADEAETILDYIESAGDAATATLSAGSRDTREDPNPEMAVFSSRGPNGAVADIIKPDVTAPGVQILAGAAPNPWLGAPGQLFQAIQGTSMSSPHAAGVAALLVGEHGDDWTPAMYQSAMTTTAHQNVDKQDGTTPGDPFDFGGGHIQPNPANDPGLVYDADFSDYVAFLCGAGELAGCEAIAIDPSDLNLATIGIGELAGTQTVTREVTNVDDAAATYTATIEAPAGVIVSQPPAIEIDPGETVSYSLTFTVTPAATLDEWAFGSITWADGAGHSVRSPIAVTPVALSAPDEVSGEGTEGELSYDVTFGYSGTFSATPQGLVPATVEEDRSVVDDPADDINAALVSGIGIDIVTITVGLDVTHLRASLFDENTDGEDDLDLYLFDPDGNFVDGSGSVTSAEQVDAPNPVDGDWTLIVHGWETDGPDAVYDLFTWQVPATDADNMEVTAPAVAVLGATETITVTWSGLTSGSRYLGRVAYSNGSDLGGTLVSIHA